MKKIFEKTLTKVFLIALFPFLLLLNMSIHYTSDVPYWDQWEIASFLQKIYSGNITLYDFWAQHNEHRIMFPRLIMMVLALLTRWNIYYEIAMNVFLGICIFAVIAQQYTRYYKLNRFITIFPFILICILSFSLIQYENWGWGFQIQIFLNVLSIVAGMAFIVRANKGIGYFVGALLCGIVATYSFANGVLFWIIGTLPIVYIVYSLKSKWIYISSWFLVAIVSIVSYYIDYHKPGSHPSLFYSLKHPVTFIEYITAYLGSSVSIFNKYACIVMGIIGLILFIFIFFNKLLTWKNSRKNDGSLYWILVSFYGLLSGTVSALGRAGFGYEQALASRYTTISNLFWFGVIGCIVGYIVSKEKKRKQISRKFTCIGLVTVLLFTVCLSTIKSYDSWNGQYYKISSVKPMLLAGCYTDELLQVYPILSFVKERSEYMREARISIFANEPNYSKKDFSDIDNSVIGSVSGIDGSLGSGQGVKSECLQANGWAINQKDGTIPNRIVAISNKKVIGQALVNIDREDVAKHFDNEKYKKSGWNMLIPSDSLKLGDSNVQFYGDYGKNKYNLIGEAKINIILPPSLENIDFTSYKLSDQNSNLFGSFDSIILQNGKLTATGWARDNNANEIAHFVGIVDQHNNLVAIAQTGGTRQDVMSAFNDTKLLNSGWTVQIDDNFIPKAKLSAYVLDIEHKKAYKMQNSHIIIK